MSPSAAPAVLSHLARIENVAVDAAIVEALNDLTPEVQHQALGTLLQRGHVPSVAVAIGRFSRLAEPAQNLLVERLHEASDAVRMSLASSRADDREGAIELIRRSQSTHLAYLLAEALCSADPHTRDLAARALHTITAGFLTKHTGDRTARESEGELLANALRDAVTAWEMHFHPKVLEAALWMSDRLYGVIEAKLDEPRSRIGHMLTGLIQTAHGPRMADFLLRALVHPTLRGAAANAIAGADTSLLQAIFSRGDLLNDPKVLSSVHFVHDCEWMQLDNHQVLTAAAGNEKTAVRFILAIAGSIEHKIRFLAELLNNANEAFIRAVTDQLAEQPGKEPAELLEWLAARAGHATGRPGSPTAGAQGSEPLRGSTPPGSRARGAPGPSPAGEFDRYWGQFDALDPQEKQSLERWLRSRPAEVSAALIVRLGSREPGDRLRAMRVSHALGLVRRFADELHAMAHDPDARVRSYAMTLMAELPGPTTERILLQAVNDADERVQANAIQSMDALGLARRVAATEPKLDSTNNRVRANAVKSLLRTELRRAGETLLQMLAHPAPAHRLSALWVISKLELRSMRGRVAGLAEQDADERVRKRAQRILEELDRRIDPAEKPSSLKSRTDSGPQRGNSR